MYSAVFLLLLTCGLSFGMLNSSPMVIQDAEDVSNPKSSSGEITISTPENKTYTEPMTGYFPATFGFENDPDGNEPEGWLLFPEVPAMSTEILPELGGHKKVIDMNKGSTSGNNYNLYQYFTEPQEFGTIELWVRTDDASDGSDYLPQNDTLASWGFGIRDNSFHYFEPIVWKPIPFPAFDNIWYHVKVQFECDSGNHYGLSEDSWRIFINGNQFGDYNFTIAQSDVRNLRIHQNWRFSNYHTYTEAVGYSWDPNYNEGDNLNEGLLLGYENTTSLDWQGYSLDGATNKTILGNATITMPANGPHNIQVFGNDTMGTMFESNIRHFSIDTSPYIIINSPLNISYSQPMNGYYPGTFGFENDEIGTVPEGWFDTSETNCYTQTISELDGHRNVLDLVDSGNPYSANITHRLNTPQTSGTFEWWWRHTNTDRREYISIFNDDGTYAFLINAHLDGNYYEWSEGSGIPYTINRWYHHRIDFDCNGNGGNGRIDWYIDEVLRESNLVFSHDGAKSLKTFELRTREEDTGFHSYYDAFSFSWDSNYNIGDNLNEGLLLSIDSNFNQNWTGYSLDGQFNRTILGNTTIPMPSDGQHRIQVFGNDSLGIMYESELRYFNVDVNPVDIIIVSPTSYELFQDTAPDFEISIDDPDLNSTWYSLDGITFIPFTGFTGTIDQTEWNKFSNGTVTIGFYANDSASNISFASVTVRKDVLGPIITVNSPQNDDVIGINAPSYDLSIEEYNLDSIWYSFDYGVTVLPLYSLTGTLDQAEWETKGGGTVPIRFYANDSLGHESFTDVSVIKDLINPLVTINYPGAEDVFGDPSPDYGISITESNLETYWYTLDGGTTNITISSLTGTVDQSEWDKHGNGTVNIKFFAEDEGGNEGVAEITVRKDTNIPLITINSPIMDDLFGLRPPQYDLTVIEPNINTMWYTLDNGVTTISFTEFTGTIDQTEWNKFGDGIVIIRFYVRDKGDNEAFSEVNVNKDSVAPIITINEPEFGEVFGDISPLYSISIDETSLDSFWYSLDDGQTNYSISELTGGISQSAWESLSDGHITLRFYAKDEAGNVGLTSVTITKSTSSESIPPGIPGYDIIALVGVCCIVTLIIIIKKRGRIKP